MSPIRTRKASRYTSIRRRFMSLSTNEQLMLSKIKKVILACLLGRRNKDPDDDNVQNINLLLKISSESYLKLIIDDYGKLRRPNKYEWTLANLEPEFCKEFLAFKKPDLIRLFHLLEFPALCNIDLRNVMYGEEVFIRGLYELVTGEKKTSIANTFGRHYSDQSRAFNYFMNFIYRKTHHLVDNNLNWWFSRGHIERSAELIEAKMNLDSNITNIYALFIDCNCLPTSRPGGGPAEEGANAARWSQDLQEAFYNGWKSIHGLKHQTVDSAYGMTVDICGPVTLRRNDMSLYRKSNINDRIKEQIELLHLLYDYCIFGDSAYKTDTNIRSYIEFDDVASRRWNGAMKRVRISIEWNYMVTGSMFRYLANKLKLKILQSSTISRIYITATILRNFYSCIYGNQTSHYFGHTFPEDFLEDYFYQR